MMEFINKIVEILKFNSVIYISIISFYLIVIYLSKKMTIPFMFFISIIFSFCASFLSSTKIFVIILTFCLFVLSALISRNNPFDFRKKILSLSLIYNSIFSKKEKGSKIIGEIIPYAEWQIKYNRKKIYMPEIVSRGITMITGSSGSGKTYQVKELVKQDMDNGKPVVFFDFKGENEIIEELVAHAKKLNIQTYEMSSRNINFNYDPLSNLNTAGKVETLLNTRKWSLDGSDAHYRSSTQLVIQKIVNEFETIWNKKENYLVGLYEFTKNYNCEKSLYQGYETLVKILELLLTSNIKSAWYGGHNKTFSFDIKEQYLVIFSFMSSNKELANSISSFVIKDLLDTGTKTAYRNGLPLYIDEFGTLENSFIVKDLLEKGRSCKIETTISLQDINQIVINTNQAYLNSILGTINNFIIYAGATKITAEIISGVQIGEIDKILMTLKKPHKGKPPTAMYISKYPYIDKNKSVDVFKIEPYTRKTTETFIGSAKDDITINTNNESKIGNNINNRIPSHNFLEDIDKEIENNEIRIENNPINYEDFL